MKVKIGNKQYTSFLESQPNMSSNVKITTIICGSLLAAGIITLATYLITQDHPIWSFWLVCIGYSVAAFSLKQNT